MARSAEDLELALKVLAGPEGRDAVAYRLALPPARHDRLSDYRVFVLTEHPTAAVDSEIVAAIDELAAGLETAGASVSRRSELLPSPAESQALVDRFTQAARAGMSPPGMSSLGGAAPTIKDYFDCVTAQEVIRRQWDTFFKAFDVVVAPCFATPAFAHFSEPDPWPGLNRTLRIDGADVAYAPQHAWPLFAGMPRLPATVAPIGRTRGGLPIGAQFIGPFLEDRTTIGFAEQTSAALGMTAGIAAAGR